MNGLRISYVAPSGLTYRDGLIRMGKPLRLFMSPRWGLLLFQHKFPKIIQIFYSPLIPVNLPLIYYQTCPDLSPTSRGKQGKPN